jgi:hypothetical protein
MEGAGGHEQDVIGLDHAVLGGHRRAFDQRQQVALHALARDFGRPLPSLREVTLSISSMKTMPFCSAACGGPAVLISSSLTSLAASSSVSSFMGLGNPELARFSALPAPAWLNMPRNCSVISSMPAGPMISS